MVGTYVVIDNNSLNVQLERKYFTLNLRDIGYVRGKMN